MQTCQSDGLSLCIQGTLKLSREVLNNLRFIPVYTGNTFGMSFVGLPAPVYPCVYREHEKLGELVLFFLGLSLCIQGTPSRVASAILLTRFIPVYTGNTLTMLIRFAIFSVYPCVYREHTRYELH